MRVMFIRQSTCQGGALTRAVEFHKKGTCQVHVSPTLNRSMPYDFAIVPGKDVIVDFGLGADPFIRVVIRAGTMIHIQ